MWLSAQFFEILTRYQLHDFLSLEAAIASHEDSEEEFEEDPELSDSFLKYVS